MIGAFTVIPGADAPQRVTPQRIGLLMLDRRSYPAGLADRADFAGQSAPTLITHHVPGCTVDRLIYEGDDTLRGAMLSASQALVAAGAEAILGDCGFMIRYQHAVRDAVEVPVLLSALMGLPLILSTLRSDQKVAVITASASSLTPELLLLAGVADLDRLVIGDMSQQPAFDASIMQCRTAIDDVAVGRETVNVAHDLMTTHPNIGAFLLECTGLPPYAAAVQQDVGRPVYDICSLADLLAGVSPGRRQLH